MEIVTSEFCSRNALPMIFGLWIGDCPELIRGQRTAMISVAKSFTKRRNLGFFSIYRTDTKSFDLLRALHIPAYKVTILAAAGHFVPINVDVDFETSP